MKINTLRRLIVAGITGIYGFSTSPLFAVETVSMLDRGEPYAAMTTSGEFLWNGSSRQNFNTNYRLQVFDANGRLLDETPLSHSINTLVEFSPGRVIATGINSKTSRTAYTVARIEGNRIKTQTSEIGVEGFINFWIATLNGRHYFADMGGNPNDTGSPTEPAQTIFYSTGTNAKYMPTRLRLPVSGLTMNQMLYVVSRDDIASTSGRIVEINPTNGSQRVLITSKTARFSALKQIPNSIDLLAIASNENQLVQINSQSGQIMRTYNTRGLTRSFGFFGRCVIVGNDGESSAIEVFDRTSSSDQPLFTEIVDLKPEEFSGLKMIAVNQTSGTVFGRASLPCNPFTSACENDYNRVISFGTAVAAKILEACK